MSHYCVGMGGTQSRKYQTKQYQTHPKVLLVLRSRAWSDIQAISSLLFRLAMDVWSRATDCSFGFCRLFQMEAVRFPETL